METKPAINFAQMANTATVEDLISHLQSTFFSADFQKVAETLAVREKNMKQILEQISIEAEKWRKEYLSTEKKHGDLLLKHLTVEEDLNKRKIQCEALKEKVIALREEINVWVHRDKQGEERYAKLLNEVKESDEKVRVLCCGKVRAEAEVENWKKKFNELDVRLSRLEDKAAEVLWQNPLLKDEIEEMIGKKVSRSAKFDKKVNVGSANRKSVELERKSSVSNHHRDETMLMSPGAGSTTCASPKMNCTGLQEADPYSFDLACGDGGANRMQLASGAESFNKMMGSSLAGGKQPQSRELIEIDSDNEEPVRDASASFVNIRASDLKSGEKKMTPELVNLEGSGQTGMENAGSWIGNSLLASNSKRKRASDVIKSEEDSSDDDNMPIGRRKVKSLQELDNLPQASRVDSFLAMPHMSGSNTTSLSPTSNNPGLGGSNVAAVSPPSCNPGLGGSNATAVSPASDNPAFVRRCTEKFEAKFRSSSDSSDSSESEDENDSDHYMENIIASIRRQREKKGWAFEADMILAFETDNELCLNAVCALHRRRSSNLTSFNSRGFLVLDALRVTALAEFLIDGDQQGKLRKSVSELLQFDPKGLDDCRKLARRHSKQLFDIYRNKEDPFFLPPNLNSD